MTKRPIKHLRWYIAILICLASELNYMDRQALSVLADTIKRELNLSTVDYGNLTSFFLASYTVMYLVSGRLVDMLGTRRSFLFFVSGWSVANMLHGLARTFGQLAFFRFLLGAMEPANFPAGVKAVTEWFPMKERALAIGIFNAGTALGSALAIPVVSFIALWFGWQAGFMVTGAVGFIWVAVWAFTYHPPQDHPRLSAEERELILAGQENEVHEEKGAAPFWTLVRMPETWGCVLARVLTDPISYFLNFWIPLYFQKERGFELKQVGAFLWIPYVALTLGNIFSGALPRVLIARGWSINSARKASMLLVSCAMPFCWLAITQVQSPVLAVAIVTAIMFGHAAWGNITLPAEVFPKTAIGTVTGLGGALGGLTGIITQQLIGRVAETSFTPIFLAGGGLYLLALLLVHWLIGELGVIRQVKAAARA
ncbi:MAG TPA: MFS transporter [Blastocatellia bacterium]|nr:MFS transporter [Blastocatellia bacterium]